MGGLLNLLSSEPKLYDGPVRDMDSAFGPTYFDGTRHQGYGGYQYDGRWKPICELVIKRYGLDAKSRVLDLGCGKGFFLADLVQVCPGIFIRGLEISEYAVQNTVASVKPFVFLGSVDALERYGDHSFDFVAAMNSLHFMTPDRVEKALREMMRVGKRGNYFVQVDAFTNETERERLLAWAPIIKTVYSVDQWLQLFRKVAYDGDYYWTFVRPSAPEKLQESVQSSS